MVPRVLIVIPAYNEEKTIAGVLLGLRQAVPEFDRIVVVDGCKDGTSRIVADLGERQLRLPCNLGYGRALQTGIKYALARRYDIVLCIDADGQHRPEDAPGLVRALLENNADMVIGSRFCQDRLYPGSFIRRAGQFIFSHLSHYVIGQRIYDTTSGFKALRAPACRLLVEGTSMDFHMESIVRLRLFGFSVLEHPVVVKERLFGQSMHSFKSVFHYPLKTLLLTLVAAIDAFVARRIP
jgi:glycosyltransferase involved in cell wall biosynthesis